MGVDVHCSREIGMPHDLLNEFNIVGAFAEPGTEGVPQVVNTKMREKIRLTVFQFSLIHFLHVVSDTDSLNRPVDVVIHVDLEHIIQGKFHDKPTAIKNQPQNPLNEWIHCHMETYLFSNQEALTVKDVRASSLRCASSYVKQCTNDNY